MDPTLKFGLCNFLGLILRSFFYKEHFEVDWTTDTYIAFTFSGNYQQIWFFSLTLAHTKNLPAAMKK